MASPVADQMLAAIEQVEQVCGANAILTEDWIVGTLVEFAQGRLTAQEEIDEEAGIAVRVVPANRDYAAESLDLDAHPNLIGPCDRCMEGQASFRIWVPNGASIVSVECCPRCRLHLDANFSPLVWRD
jgi:hypothetical protein